MNQEIWTAVDQYFGDIVLPRDPALDAALASSAAAKLPSINVSPMQGQFLHLLARIAGAKKILEIGTLGGYSTIWLARALPVDGKLITLELDPRHAKVAQANINGAGLGKMVEIRVAPAIESLPKLAAEKSGPFDFIFIDADKPSTMDYFSWAMKLSRVGTVIVVDNVVREGAVIEEYSSDPAVQGIRKFNDYLKTEQRVVASAIQTVGSKKYDGMVIVQRVK
jgi:predicted O-methyltransferase YrrM